LSAFAGFAAFDPSDLPPGTAERLTNALDGKGLAKPLTRRLDGGVFVFRQRVLSPEDRFERQPVLGGGGAVVSMFDGRLDNRAELLDALGLHSPANTPIPDGELVRAAYERWAEEAVPRLLGDFAWAVWDGGPRRLLLARDHSCTRALFYTRTDRFVAFATGYRPLLALPEVPREVDELAAAELLLTCSDESGRSFYKGISWVGSAERVIVSASGVRGDRLWEPAARPPLRLSDGECVEAARAVFEQAVACRLRIAGPVVVGVSGGLDSSAVAATAASRLAPGRLHGLCVVPDETAPVSVSGWRYADERPYVRALAARYPNLSVEFLASIEPEAIERDPTALFLQTGVPMRGPGNLGWFLRTLRRTGELDAGTLLGGDLGNLAFSADGLDRLSELRRDGAWGRFTREMLALRRTQPAVAWHRLVGNHILRTLPPGAAAQLRTWRHGNVPRWWRGGAINPDFLHATGLDKHYARHGIVNNDWLAAGGRVALMRYSLIRSRMMSEGAGALRTLTGVTMSDPFADRRVLDFCLALPADQFLRDGQTRSLARRAFADRLPPEIASNTRRGAQNTDWHARLTPLRDSMAADIERLERSALASRLLDIPRLKGIIDRWPKDGGAVLHDGSDGTLFRVTLLRALHLGRYLRWVEGGNE